MAIQSIEGIRIKNFPNGQFAGGFIYGANFTLGGVDGPSRLTLSVVNEGVTAEVTRKYQGLRSGQIHKRGLSVKNGDEYTIHVGSIRLEMHLVGFNEEKTPDLHTMNYEFVDTSHILDRIYIGLPNRHQKPESKEGRYLVSNLEAMCPNCWTGEVNRKVSASMIALRDAAYCTEAAFFARNHGDPKMEYNFQYNPKNGKTVAKLGGIITLGREEFIDHGSSAFKPLATQTQKYKTEAGTVTYSKVIEGELPCDVPNVTYKFVDLLAAIEMMGITIKGLTALGRNSWRRGVKNDYRQAYTGTLREVLNNWCADFGFSFTWGMGERSIIFIDLSKGVESSFEEIKDLVENAKKASSSVPNKPFLINNISYSTDMMNTYSNNYLSYYLKPHRPKSYNPAFYRRLYFHCLRINEVFTPAACGMPGASWTRQSVSQFLISCTLAKFDSTARTLFNILMKRWWAIGIQPTYEFSTKEKDDIFQHLNSDNLESVLTEMAYNLHSTNINYRPASFVDAYVAYIDEDQASQWEDFERAIADEFLGQHYLLNPSPTAANKFDLSEFEACMPVMNIKQTLEMTPSANKITNSSEVPWAKIAARSPAVQSGANAYVAGWLAQPHVRNIYHIQVPAAYGVIQDQVDAALHGKSAGDADGFKDLEKGVGWYDNAMIDSSLWNHATNADEALRAALEEEGKIEEALRGTGLTKFRSKVREASVGGNGNPSSYTNPYNGVVTKIKEKQHPKLLVVAPDYIRRNPSGVSGGLGFAAEPAGNGFNQLASMGRVQGISISGDCAIRCESSILETLCKCPTDSEKEADFFVGLGFGLTKGLRSGKFMLKGPHGVIPVVLPINSMPIFAGESESLSYMYHGFAKTSAEIRVLLEGKKLVLDGDKENKRGFESINTQLSNLPENTLGIRVNAKDITNDADMVFQALNSSDNPLDSTASLIKVVVPSNTKDGDIGSETMMTLEEYHRRIKDHFNRESADSVKPSRSLSFSLLGTYYDIDYKNKNLKNFLSPEKGLTGFSVSFGSEGVVTNFTFETKPKVLPKLEATMNKIGPTVWKSWYS